MPPLDLDQGGRIPQVVKTYLGPTTGWKYTDAPSYIEFVFNGGGGVLAPGYYGALIIPDWLHVTNWVLASKQPGSAGVDVYKITLDQYLAGATPSAANSITGTELPTLNNSVCAQSSVLMGWTTRIDQKDVLGFNINFVTSIQELSLWLLCVRDIGPS